MGFLATKPDQSDLRFYFKLFNNLKDESEGELARRELHSLFGPVEVVQNFIDEYVAGSLPQAVAQFPGSESLRLQDALSYELPYGRIQGFKGVGKLAILPKLVRRLAYTREIYVVSPPQEGIPSLGLANGINIFTYSATGLVVVRTITNQYFLEKSHYISKLSRNKEEIDANLETLVNYMALQSHRIPATETMAVGRRLEDWFAIREEPSLYLTHYMHPYKGKFHPKMARALINYVFPQDKGRVLDNFSGSGTTLVEAQWLSLDSVGVDINPLSSLMSQVKVNCLQIDSNKLRSAITDFLRAVREAELLQESMREGQTTLSDSGDIATQRFGPLLETLPGRVRRDIPNSQLIKILTAKEVLAARYGKLDGNDIQEFLLLGISGAISDVARRTSTNFFDVLEGRLKHLWGRVYLAERMLVQLRVRPGKGVCYVGDTRDLSQLRTVGGTPTRIEDESIDCVVNSPPYSTALDYIRNDLPQLSILNLAEDMNSLERNLVGNPNLRVYDKNLQNAIVEGKLPFSEMPDVGKEMLMKMLAAGRRQEAGRVLKFWVDMKQTLGEIGRVLKPSGRAAIVIGDNNIQLVKGSDKFERIPNVAVLRDLSQSLGLSVVEVIQREIEKSMTGMIRNESIIILAKVSAR